MKQSKVKRFINNNFFWPVTAFQMAQDAQRNSINSTTTTPSKNIVIHESSNSNASINNDKLLGPNLSGREQDFLAKLYKCKTFDSTTTLGFGFPITKVL